MNREERDQRIKQALEVIKSPPSESLEYDSQSPELKNFEMAIDFGYVRKLKLHKMWGITEIVLSNAYITEAGFDFLEGKKPESNPQFVQHNTFNAPVSGSSFGTNNPIVNNFNNSLDNLENFIASLPKEEQKIANEILETIKSQDVKPGMFKKFSSFFEKHPNIVGYLGQATVWALTNPDKLPFF